MVLHHEGAKHKYVTRIVCLCPIRQYYLVYTILCTKVSVKSKLLFLKTDIEF